MNLRRETGVSLGKGGSPNLVQADTGNFRYFQSQPKPKRDPIAQGFAQFTLTASQRLVLGPYSLQPGDFTPVPSLRPR